MQDSAPAATVKADCCTVRGTLPAIVAERETPNPNSFSTVISFAPAAELAAKFEGAVPIAAAHSLPPPGKSILRI